MENQFSRIGQLVYDLEANTEFEDSPANYEFLKEEFKRIIMQLGYQWVQNEMGAPYLLEFHAVECRRLRDKIKVIRDMFLHIWEFRAGKEFLLKVFEVMIGELAELQQRIEKMINEKADVPFENPFLN